MTKNQRVRRVALLCCHLTRNLAYFRAGWKELQPKREGEFWITILGNFIDTSILEWSKLFGDEKGKHHWKRIVDNEAMFKSRLMNDIGISEAQWRESWKQIKDYRDKFIAHLDSEDTMYIPQMDIPFRMVNFLYDELKTYNTDPSVLAGLPSNMSEYFDHCYKEGLVVFKHNHALKNNA